MPYGMSEVNTTKTIRDWYLYSFIDMLDFGRPKYISHFSFLQNLQGSRRVYKGSPQHLRPSQRRTLLFLFSP